MKLNISHPANGTQKTFVIEDEKNLFNLMGKRMGQEISGDSLGEEFRGYVFKITGGNDKQGFPMLQGILHATRVRLLLSDCHKCFFPRRSGQRRRKSVRGCIVGPDLAVLALSIVKPGQNPLPNLTDIIHPKRLGPKRASKIRRFFCLSKVDDVRQYVIRRQVKPCNKNHAFTKAPKIQRLLTPQKLQRKRRIDSMKKLKYVSRKEEAVRYEALLQSRKVAANTQL